MRQAIRIERSKLDIAVLIVVLSLATACQETVDDGNPGGGSLPDSQVDFENKLVTFDMRSGVETVHHDPSFAVPQSTTPLISEAPWQGAPDVPVPLIHNNLQVILTPSGPHYSMVAKVVVLTDAPGGFDGTHGCSGTLIGPRYLLTAAHCIYDGQRWAKHIAVNPGSQFGSSPFGVARGEVIYTFTGLVEHGHPDYDLAIVTLDRPIGFLAGWREPGTHPDCEFWLEPGWSMAGYPGQEDPVTSITYDGTIMTGRAGSYDECGSLPTRVISDSYNLHGMSGAGAVKAVVQGSGVQVGVWGVHRGGIAEPDGSSATARFDEFMYRSALFAIESTTPDAADLVVVDTTSPKVNVRPGEDVEGVSFLVANLGKTSFAGEVRAHLRRSEDERIDRDDHNIFMIRETIDLDRNETVRLTYPPVKLAGTTFSPAEPGRYYLGVHLFVDDSNDNNDDTLPEDMEPIRVLHPGEFPIDDLLGIRRIR